MEHNKKVHNNIQKYTPIFVNCGLEGEHNGTTEFDMRMETRMSKVTATREQHIRFCNVVIFDETSPRMHVSEGPVSAQYMHSNLHAL